MQTSNDLLRELQGVVQSFQAALDVLSQKAIQGNGKLRDHVCPYPRRLTIGSVSFPKGKLEVPSIDIEPLSIGEAIKETQSGPESRNGAVKAWLTPEKTERFLERCTKHER